MGNLISGVTVAESSELDANNAQIKSPPYRQFDHDPFRIHTLGSTIGLLNSADRSKFMQINSHIIGTNQPSRHETPNETGSDDS